MSLTKNITTESVRIIPKAGDFLDRKLGSRGEVFFDQEAATLRLFDGIIPGGIPLLRADLGNVNGVLGASIGDTPPADVRAGTIWFNSSSGKLYIYYNDGNSYQWVQPATPSTGGAGGGGSSTLTGLNDVTITSPVSGQSLVYNGTRWTNSAGGGGISGPLSSTANAVAVYNGTSGSAVKNSLVTIASDGAIVAPLASSIIPFHWDNTAQFPNASQYHGAIAHSHADGRMYFAHSGAWVGLANQSELSGGSSLPSQSGNSGKFLTTDGTSLSWATVSQAGGSTTFAGLTEATSAGLTVDQFYMQAIVRLSVTNVGSSAYLFSSHYSGNNPSVYAIGGMTIAFNLNVLGHPFLIQDPTGTNYNTGLIHVDTGGGVSTGSNAQGRTTGTLYWQVPASISGTYRYQCAAHPAMVGGIVVKNVVSL